MFAQIDTGTVPGVVKGPAGVNVPGAQLAITQIETNSESVSQAGSDGVYRVPSLRPGPNRVSVAAPGFKKFTREGLTLRIGENPGVDVKLEVGAVNESSR